MHFDEFRWIFHHCLLESELCFDDEGFPHISSLEITPKDEGAGYYDYDHNYDNDNEWYILNIKAGKTVVIDGIRLPLVVALKAIAILLQRKLDLTVIDVTETSEGAQILFESNEYGVETGVAKPVK